MPSPAAAQATRTDPTEVREPSALTWKSSTMPFGSIEPEDLTSEAAADLTDLYRRWRSE